MTHLILWFEPTNMHELFYGAFCYDFRNRKFSVYSERQFRDNLHIVDFKAETFEGKPIKIKMEDSVLLKSILIKMGAESTKNFLNHTFAIDKDGFILVKGFYMASYTLLEEVPDILNGEK